MANAHFLLCALSDVRMGNDGETVVMNEFPVLSTQIGRLAFLPAELLKHAIERFFYVCHFRKYIWKVFYSFHADPFYFIIPG